MKVIVVGKQRRYGTSKKSGNPYDNTVVYYLSKRRNVEGECGSEIWLDSNEHPLTDIIVGGTYEAEFDGGGYLQSFELVDAG